MEVELKLDAGDATFRGVLRTLSTRYGFRLGAPVETRQHDEYIDSTDWWLYRAGVALRARWSSSELRLTLKSLTRPVDGVARRLEIEERVPRQAVAWLSLPPGRIRDLLDASGAPLRLRPLFQIHTTRRLVECRRGADRLRVSLDQCAIVVRSKRHAAELGRFDEVEVEHAGGRVASANRVLAALVRQGTLPLSPVSKFERGLHAIGLVPVGAEAGGGLRLEPADQFGDVVYRILGRHFDQIVEHTPGSRLGVDPEYLHDMRVAIRRLRTALRVFRAVLPDGARQLAKDWKAVARVLGGVRDCDVQIEIIAARLPPARGGRAWLHAERERVLARRAGARRRMLRMLDSAAYRGLLRRFRALLDGRRPRRGAAAVSMHAVTGEAMRALDRTRGRVLRRGQRAMKRLSPARLHVLRIACKRLRYVAEWFDPVSPDSLSRLIRKLSKLQDVLGEHHDATVALEHLRRAQPPAPAALERLHRARVRRAEARFPKRWRRFVGACS